MRLIDSRALIKRIDCYPKAIRDAAKIAISLTPTVKDAVVVVRCRDCKYGIEWDERLCCEWHGFYNTEPEWYCADGERENRDGG